MSNCGWEIYFKESVGFDVSFGDFPPQLNT